jgi:apolipoprotein N-acyltransferase
VAAEYWRAFALSGFPWFFLAHSHYKVLTMIQISDLLGAYGLTAVIAMVNGVIAEALSGMPPRKSARGRLRVGAVLTSVLLIATIAYGRYQLSRGTMTTGPTVAVIQGNYPSEVMPGPDTPSPPAKRARYEAMMREAAAERPDVFVLPESPWLMFLNSSLWEQASSASAGLVAWSKACHDFFQTFANEHDAVVIAGGGSLEFHPTQVYPTEERFNSAFVFRPGGARAERYDKVHLVMFGEYVPFRGGRLHFLYRWLNGITPWGADGEEYSCTHGKEFRRFELPDGDRRFRFGIPICYEDTMPYVGRKFVLGADGKKDADFLLNISNDGWYDWGFELPQHLAASVFRAVENRVGVARAVNCGISAVIDANGQILDTVNDNGRTRGPGIDGYLVAPLTVDARLTLYTRIGDVFAIGCTVLACMMLLDAAVCRWIAIARRGGRGDSTYAPGGART